MSSISHPGTAPCPRWRAIGKGSGPAGEISLFYLIASDCQKCLNKMLLQGQDIQASVDAFDGTEWAPRGERFVWWIGMVGIVGFLCWTAFILIFTVKYLLNTSC